MRRLRSTKLMNTKQYSEMRLIWDLVWPDLALIRMKVSPKTKNLTYVYLYRGAFEQFTCPRRGAFAGLFSKNPNAQGSARGGMGTAGNDLCTIKYKIEANLNWFVTSLRDRCWGVGARHTISRFPCVVQRTETACIGCPLTSQPKFPKHIFLFRYGK